MWGFGGTFVQEGVFGGDRPFCLSFSTIWFVVAGHRSETAGSGCAMQGTGRAHSNLCQLYELRVITDQFVHGPGLGR